MTATANPARKRVCVLHGGFSSERSVSLESGRAVAAGLERSGHQVSLVDVSRDLPELIRAIQAVNPDVIFNALHGHFGEDGGVQGILEVLGIPYTHSGALASAVAMNKPLTQKLFARAGIPVAEHVVAPKDVVLAGEVMPRPYVIKPPAEGSSYGVLIVHEDMDGIPLSADTWPFGEEVMVERFIPGRELTVAVMGDRALAVTEIVTDNQFYDFEAKYAPGGSRHILPAPIPEDVTREAMDLALRAHRTLHCRGVSRTDFRYDGTGLYALEINTQPGMTATSLVPEQARHVGISFEDLVSWMVGDATCPR
ncbi:D-alanine--D-alanine ligase [Phaeovibrio sulfidiphilus]|uniref:D-alanine--D-alanine ligase n=1 Tax=Phaeovibrio sulfidiphilus TaxID=1220600 RepID=A0A8J6YN36_9PROT|nr:D-alanine--D-alanine ligase [Phaeovibrio sulfidiphilus]MBE1237520.1 D-alanine--D-alanine ligase [Phaeovibrio sulfidiphilus]